MHQVVFCLGTVPAQTKLGHPVPVVSPSPFSFPRWPQLGSHPKTEADGQGVCVNHCPSWGTGPWKGGATILGELLYVSTHPMGWACASRESQGRPFCHLWLQHPNGLAGGRGSPGSDKRCPVCFTGHYGKVSASTNKVHTFLLRLLGCWC